MKGELGGGAAVTACSVSLIGGDRSLPLPFPGSPQEDHPAFTSTCGKAAPRRVVFPQRSRTRRCDRAPAGGREHAATAELEAHTFGGTGFELIGVRCDGRPDAPTGRRRPTEYLESRLRLDPPRVHDLRARGRHEWQR